MKAPNYNAAPTAVQAEPCPAIDRSGVQSAGASVLAESVAQPLHVAAAFWQGRADHGPSRFASQAALLDAYICQTEHGPEVLVTVHGERLANVEIALAPEAAQAFEMRMTAALQALPQG